MQVYRITAPRHVSQALSGVGAANAGGRWNSRGTRLAYAASSISLATIEMLVHVDRRSAPPDRRLLSFDIPDALFGSPMSVSADWNQLPYSPRARAAGDAWIKSMANLEVRVPSAAVKYEYNVLINPEHTDFNQITLVFNEPLLLDSRFFG